jgi:serine phosphatase RsbU (regulator of sigma subunit)
MRTAPLVGVDQLLLYVIDYSQACLMPFGTERDPLPVDSTVAGRAFAVCEQIEVAGEGRHRLFTPISDCGHRLGVLEAVAGAPFGAEQRRELAALATSLAHLVATRQLYGDAVERVRRRLPMQLATEVVWSLLPPLTYATDGVAISGILEPCYDVGGDAFDYAIDGQTMHVALFDAVGHGIGASTLTTIAVNAYRNARRCGLGLLDTCRSIDTWVHAQFPDLFVTAVIAELDVETGTYRYVSAGHPSGLLLRDARLVRELPGPTGMPLGLGRLAGAAPEIAEESLEPGDSVVLYTDGVVEARDESGEFFGQQRLVDFVTRTFADRMPVAETMRRLVRAILDHQHENLQDDATALLLNWSPPR